jgi:glucosamine-6-phosphate deaminase
VTIRIFPTARAACRALALRLITAIRDRPDLVIGLPSGRTPIPLYRELVAAYGRGRVDFSRITTFTLDEFVGLPPSDPRSYRSFMQRHLFDHLNAPPRRVHFPDGAAPDLDRESQRYERAIERAGGIDVMILGLGTNGHIGFNEPGRSLVARTHLATLTRESRRANRDLFGGQARRVPRQAISMGMATILQARHIVMLATGSEKARCVANAVRGPLTTRLPASFLQLHADSEAWLDRAASGLLDVK